MKPNLFATRCRELAAAADPARTQQLPALFRISPKREALENVQREGRTR